MKIILLLVLLVNVAYADVYQFKLKKAKGGAVQLKSFKDKYILVTNIATKCGYTPQLTELEKLSTKKNLVVLAIPSNDFGSQTPESNDKVVEFCKVKYGIDGGDFILTEKSVVKGKGKIELMSYLQSKTTKKEINWNFEKYLIAPGESKITHFSSGQVAEIAKALK